MIPVLPNYPPAVPHIFVPAIEDDEHYHVGEDKVDRCLRDAIKVAGLDRYKELTRGDRSASLTDFLTKSRDEGRLGSDTNHDGNSVIGLANHVKSAAKDNPKFDPHAENAALCRHFVRQFTSDELLDELILTWANTWGYLANLPPTRPQIKEEHAEPTVTSDYEIYSTIFPGDGSIPVPTDCVRIPEIEQCSTSEGDRIDGVIDVKRDDGAESIDEVDGIREAGKTPHAPRSAAVSNSAARSLHHGHVSLNEQGLPANITIPGLNFSLPVKWKVHGDLTSGDSSTQGRPTWTVDSIHPEKDLPNAVGRSLDGALPENSAPLSRRTVPADSPSLEKLVDAQLIRGSTGPFNSTRLDDVADALVPPPNSTRLDDVLDALVPPPNTTYPQKPPGWCGNEDLDPPKPYPLFPGNRTRLDDRPILRGGRIAQQFQA